MKTTLPLLLLFLFMLLHTSCFKKIGQNLTEGLSQEADSISHHLVQGAINNLTDPKNEAKIKQMAESLVEEIFKETEKGLNKLSADSIGNKLVSGAKAELFDPKVKEHLTNLLESVLSSAGKAGNAEIDLLFSNLLSKLRSREMNQTVDNLRNELLGLKTRTAINRLLQESLDSLDTDKFVGSFRDELLSDKTNKAVRTIIDSAMTTIAYRIENDINPVLKNDLDFVQKYAWRILFIIGLLTAGIISFVWYQRRKYLRMSTLLASEIQQIPDQRVYDTLTKNIKDKAVDHALEPDLRALLKSNGLLGKEDWKAHKEKG